MAALQEVGDWVRAFTRRVVPYRVPEYDHEHYLIHDNGGKPFVVYLAAADDQGNRGVAVYAVPYDDEDTWPTRDRYVSQVWEGVASVVWVGTSPRNSMTEFSGGHGPAFDGNSILLKLARDSFGYVHIGRSIRSFVAANPIVSFTSPVGNSDVPYPYATDATGRHYLMIEDVCVQGVQPGADPYDAYYGHVQHPPVVQAAMNSEILVARR
jgi:hypothetical protein